MPTGTSGWRSRKPRDQGEAVRACARRRRAPAPPPPGSPARRRPDRRRGCRPRSCRRRLRRARRGSRRCVSRSGSPSMTKAPNTPSPSAALEHRLVAAHPAESDQRLRLRHVLVAAPGEVDRAGASGSSLRRASAHGRARGPIRRRRRCPRSAPAGEGVERLRVGRADIFGAAAVLEDGRARARPRDNRGPPRPTSSR